MAQSDYPMLPPEVEEMLRVAVNYGDLRDLNDVINLAFEGALEFERRMNEDPSGLPVEGLKRLFGAELADVGDVVKLREDLTLEELGGSVFLANARTFLAKTAAAPVRATKKGNLNRAFVLEMRSAMLLDDRQSYGLSIGKVNREDDLRPLNVLRVVLGVARLVRKYRGHFMITKRGLDLSSDDRAGALQAHLFRTFFGVFNLAYLDWSAADPLLQETMPYTLFMLSRAARKWMAPEAFRDSMLLAEVREEVDENDYFDESLWRVESRVIEPLLGFGLLERRVDPTVDSSAQRSFRHPYQVRKTPLFDRFLFFDLD